MSAEAKATLRAEILRRRDALPDAERASSGRRIIDTILGLPAYERSRTVLAYASFGSELRTDEFLRHALDGGKRLVLPRVESGRLVLYEVSDIGRDLAPATWGIREPVPDLCPPASPNEVDFALVPGVAFDPKCRRLGYGGGFYDRLLGAGLSDGAPTVAGAFGVQIVDEVPVDPSDIPVNAVITEAQKYHTA